MSGIRSRWQPKNGHVTYYQHREHQSAVCSHTYRFSAMEICPWKQTVSNSGHWLKSKLIHPIIWLFLMIFLHLFFCLLSVSLSTTSPCTSSRADALVFWPQSGHSWRRSCSAGPLPAARQLPLQTGLERGGTRHSFIAPGPPVQPVLHDADEFLVGKLIVVIYIKNLEDGVYKVTCQLQPSGYIYCSCKLILSNGARCKIIHLHCNRKVLKVVEELEEGSELVKGNSLKWQKKKRKRSNKTLTSLQTD